MKENKNIKDIFEKMSKAEDTFDLFNLSYNGIPVWTYVRERTTLISEKEGKYISNKPVRINVLNLLKRIFVFLFNLGKLFNNETIIIVNERHLQWDKEKEKYYHPYVESILAMHHFKKILILEFPHFMTQKYKKVEYDRYLPLDLFLSIKQVFFPLFYFFYKKRADQEYYNKLCSAALWSDREIKGILEMCYQAIHSILSYGVFLKILKFLNPRAEFVYSCMGGADKFLEVVEIQHGVIHNLHCQYIYPQTSSVRGYLRRKKIIVFSKKIRKLLVDNGYFPENITATPNPKVCFHFLRNFKKDFFLKQNLTPNKILIIGAPRDYQQQVTKSLLFDIERERKKLQNWEISLLLHPGEINIYKNLNLTKTKVIENKEISVFRLLSDALCVVAMYSSVLEEAKYFGCFNLILSSYNEQSDQEHLIDWMCGDYPYKVIISPDKAVDWFKENEEKIINQRQEKKKIMEDSYNYFLNETFKTKRV